jgi:hypothetical protein
MGIEFSLMKDHEAVVIKADGHVDVTEMMDMRRRSVEIAEETAYSSFIVDISDLLSIENGSTFAAYDLGERFRDSGFSYESKTAVIMPTDPDAKKQAEFLHTVEINRGRGAMKYVDTIDAALYWFRSSEISRSADH